MDDDIPAAAAASSAASSSPPASLPADATAASSSPTSGLRSFMPDLPPGYHFLPTHDELVVHYLRPRLAEQQLPLPIFFDERVLDYHPDRLIEKHREYGEDRWFFFAKRERKHEGGSRPNRTTPDNGHWNATGSPRLVRSGGTVVGRLRTLVFYEASRRKKKKQSHGEGAGLPPLEEEGNANKGVKTDWTMYEYESFSSKEESVETSVNGNAKMDVIVLCTIQKKKQTEGETKKRKAREKIDVAQGIRAGGNKPRKKRDEAPVDDDQVPNLEANFNVVDPNANMSHCFADVSPPVTTTPPRETTMASAASGDSQITTVHPSTAMHHHHYSNHAMTSSQFQQAPLPSAQVFLPYSKSKTIRWTMDGSFASDSGTAPPEGMPTGWFNEYPERVLLQNTIMMAAPPEAHRTCSFGSGFSNSGYGFVGDGRHFSTGGTDFLGDVSSFRLPPQPSCANSTQEALLHNGVRVNLASFAPTMVGSEEWWSWPRSSAQASSKET